MQPHVLAAGTSTTGWVVGYTIGIVVVLVVVALVVPILLLARSIGNEAPKINDALTDAVTHTAPLAALRTTIEHATIIIGGLQRGRARLGGERCIRWPCPRPSTTCGRSRTFWASSSWSPSRPCRARLSPWSRPLPGGWSR